MPTLRELRRQSMVKKIRDLQELSADECLTDTEIFLFDQIKEICAEMLEHLEKEK